jgi:hypothetical protein
MTNFLKRNRFVFFMAFLALFCWGRLLFLRGVWWDDWTWVWHYFGSRSVSEYLSPTLAFLRPLDGLFSLLHFKFFDIIPMATTNVYNIERFLVFLLNAFLLYRIAKLTLHAESLLPQIIAIVYLVSPLVHNLSFSETIRRIYLCLFLVSVIFTIKSITNNTKIKRGYYLMAIVLSSFAVFGYECFILFDLLRPLIILYILTEKSKEKTPIAIQKTFLYWLPFLIIGIMIALYKLGLIIPRSGPYAHAFDSYNLPLYRFLGFVIYGYIYSLYYLLLGHILHFIKTAPLFNYDLIVIILPLLAAFSVFLYAFGHRSLQKEKDKYAYSGILIKEAWLVASIGIFLILLGIAPYPLFNRYLSFGSESRHAIVASIGFSVFVSSALLLLFYKGLLKRGQFCIALSLVVLVWAFGSNDAVRAYNNDWQQQRSFWWQFIWRAPDIKDKTFLIIDMPREEGLYLGNDWCGIYEFGAPLNLLYAKSQQKGEVYKNDYFAESLGRAILESKQYYLKNWDKEEVSFDSYLVPLKYYPRNLLLASYHNGFLYLNKDISRENSSKRLNLAPLVANLSQRQIIYKHSQHNFPFRWIIGPEPKKAKKALRQEIWQRIFGKNVYKDWRYYFQKIKVLEHTGDYKGIVDLYNEADVLGWAPRLPQAVPLSVVESLYLAGSREKANFLLWKWALSCEGDFKKASGMLYSIKNLNSDRGLHAAIEEEIKDIWKGHDKE